MSAARTVNSPSKTTRDAFPIVDRIEYIEIGIPYSVPLVECRNEECGQTFAYQAVFPAFTDEEGEHHNTSWMPQAWARFCPYCGKGLGDPRASKTDGKQST